MLRWWVEPTESSCEYRLEIVHGKSLLLRFRHFGFHGATVCVCTILVIQCGLLPNKYVNQPLNPKAFG